MAGQGRKKTVFYGPHACKRGGAEEVDQCGMMIVKEARAEGGVEYDYPTEGPYPNTKWKKHVCSKQDVTSAAATV